MITDQRRFEGMTTVFLDLDDTLWNFSANSRVALRHTYDFYQLAQWEPNYEQFEHIYEVRNAELWHDYHHGRVTREHLIAERFKYALERIGCTGDIAAMGIDMNEHYLNHLASLPTLVPGAREILQHLHRRGYSVHVLSNGFAGIQQQKLVSGGIDDLIDSLVLSDDCGITKPQRGIFDYALQMAGSTAPATVMIGDDPDTDIDGAHRAGWRTIYYNAKQRDAVPGTADAEVSHLTEVATLL